MTEPFGITSEPHIKGGIPIIAGTRIDAYSVEQRLDGGETIDDLIADYPEIPREAFEAASRYAREHPRAHRAPGISRPGA
jgi:uncharacterized protein (DUF433 family)